MHINYEKIEGNIDAFKDAFINAKPFPILVIDDFLFPDSFLKLVSSIPAPDLRSKSSDYVFAKNKYENPGFGDLSNILSEVKEELLGVRFQKIISNIANVNLFVDKSFAGGGIHQGGSGSFLDMHVDFNRHPAHSDWLRVLNVLLYLNEDYREEWGGHLDLYNSISGERSCVAPVGNRLVLMLTNDYTYHGYKSIKFPQNKFRTSLATYAYTIDTDFSRLPARTTVWSPEEGGVLKRSFAKYVPILVGFKNKFFGSSTVRRASKK